MQTVKKGFRFGDISKAEALFKIYWNFKSGMFKRNLSGQKCVTLLPQVMRGTFSSELRSFICVLEPDFFEHTHFMAAHASDAKIIVDKLCRYLLCFIIFTFPEDGTAHFLCFSFLRTFRDMTFFIEYPDGSIWNRGRGALSFFVRKIKLKGGITLLF